MQILRVESEEEIFVHKYIFQIFPLFDFLPVFLGRRGGERLLVNHTEMRTMMLINPKS
jgi:hypothetical protein